MTEPPKAAAVELAVRAEEASPVLRVLHVEVPEARVQRAFDEAYRDLARRVHVKGFRPGKTPRSVLERLYGSAVVEDLERKLVAETLPQAVERAGAAPVAEPTVESRSPAPGAAFSYTARVEVKPRIEAPDLAGLKGRRPAVSVSEQDVARELEALRARGGSLVEEPAGTAVEDGHFVTIDYVGRAGGKGFRGGSARGATFRVGGGGFPPGFEEGLRGMRAGEDREIAVAVPEGSGFGEADGREATFAVHLVAVKRIILPELDDAFARDAGGCETLDALRQRIAGAIRAAREREARAALRRSLMDGLLARVDFPVPPGLVERRLEARLEAVHRSLSGAVSHEELHHRIEEWREAWRPDAEREVREDLLLEAIGEALGLAPDDAAVAARIDEIAREEGIDARRLRRSYEERGQRPALRAAMLREGALDHLIARAEIEEVAAG